MGADVGGGAIGVGVTMTMHWTIVAASFAALMAMSRTYLGAHWASDVVAGACIGTGLAVAWPAALELGRECYRARAPAVISSVVS